MAFEKEDLGEYRGNSLKLRTGKYGAYLEFGTVKQSIRDIGVPLENVDYAKAVEFLDSILKTTVDGDGDGDNTNIRLPPPAPGKGILRAITSDMSVRSGKFGPYIYYKTSTMKVPKFLALKKFPHKYDTCDLAVLEKWVKSFD